MKIPTLFFAAALLSLALSQLPASAEDTATSLQAYKQKLSEYEFFEGQLAELKATNKLLPYEVNTELFADHAHKQRFIYLPQGEAMRYEEGQEQPLFPQGSMLVKSFYYPHDFRKPEGTRQILETRILLLEEKGWTPLNYVWNEEQTEAVLDVSMQKKAVTWKDKKGKKQSLDYQIPNLGMCNTCHTQHGKFLPIGSSYKQLDAPNKQLDSWAEQGLLLNLPKERSNWPRLVAWNKADAGSLELRARSWLDVNCAHCHRSGGTAQISSLFLDIETKEPEAYGINKEPLMRHLASKERPYDIVPGHPEQSILVYRLEAEDMNVRMPKGICQTTPDEAIALVKAWIKSMN